MVLPECYRKSFLSFTSGGFPHHQVYCHHLITNGLFHSSSAYIFISHKVVVHSMSRTLGEIIAFILTLTLYALQTVLDITALGIALLFIMINNLGFTDNIPIFYMSPRLPKAHGFVPANSNVLSADIKL